MPTLRHISATFTGWGVKGFYSVFKLKVKYFYFWLSRKKKAAAAIEGEGGMTNLPRISID